ncbi:MAG: exocyst complex component exo84 [Chrysothrix sp. TS-e1954]|nr:MAG: exocyst complex component exo84 [Chrysothrix sp. TS-e1954]
MEGRGLSLRKKRSVKPKISAPRQISAPIASPPTNHSQSSLAPPSVEGRSVSAKSSQSSLNSQRTRRQAPGNTADYVKRRYSTRITQAPQDFNPPSLPTVPDNFLAQPPARSGRPANGANGDKVAVDLKALQDPHLQADQYVAQFLANATEHEIRDYQHDLNKIKNRTSTDLQHNVYQNRNQFIKISQGAEKLRSEMRALRNLMSDLTNTLGQTNAALGIKTDHVGGRKHAHRSSVANLEAMWSTHLQELWRRVEGSQKYLPAIPGRHVVHESGRWVELHTATFKPRRRVHLILLNDHLLVGVEKKRHDQSPQPSESSKPKSSSSQVQLLAERCWPLQDVEIADLSNEQNLLNRRASRPTTSNAMTIKAGNESFTYAAADSSSSEKATFLARFRKAVADLRKNLHADFDERPNRRSILLQSSMKGLTNGVRSNTDGPDNSEMSSTARGSMLVEVDGRQQNYRWVEAQVDELDIDIALQRFDEAVDRVEKLRRIAKSNKNNSFVQSLVEGRVQERAAKLAKVITRRLVETNSFMTATRKHVSWLNKLGFDASASEAFLNARTQVIKTRTSQCADVGDLHQYLFQLSYIYFTLIRNTVSIFQSCFSATVASACIKWAKQHVDDFNLILSRQISTLEPGGEEWTYCLDRAREHAGLLAEVGIDFRHLIGKGLRTSAR